MKMHGPKNKTKHLLCEKKQNFTNLYTINTFRFSAWTSFEFFFVRGWGRCGEILNKINKKFRYVYMVKKNL